MSKNNAVLLLSAIFALMLTSANLNAQDTAAPPTGNPADEDAAIGAGTAGVRDEYEKTRKDHEARLKLTKEEKEAILKDNLFRAMRSILMRQAQNNEDVTKVAKIKPDNFSFEREKGSFNYYVKFGGTVAYFRFVSDPRRFVQDPIRIYSYKGASKPGDPDHP